ncbi:MAG: response regulator [Magnetococcales bacterium]|nr:response regulator [Magnetococcales bacterium]
MKSLILVVDSDTDSCQAIGQFLESSGYEVVNAESDEMAFRVLSNVSPAVIILDANIPEAGGFETCSKIQNWFTDNDIPVIMMIPLESAESVDQTFSSGAQDYITKPVNWRALEHRLKMILERKAMANTLHNKHEEMEVHTQDRRREQVRATEDLFFSEEKFRILVESAPDTILVMDEKGKILFINHSLPGQDDNNMMGTCVLDILPEQSKSRFELAVNRLFTQEKSDSFLIVGPSSTWWKVRAIPLQKRSNAPLQSAMIIVADKTEKHNIQTKAMQNARLATIGTLAASIAHEVNNPNNAILLQASWLVKVWQKMQMHTDEEQYANVAIEGYSYQEVKKRGSEFLANIVSNSRRIGTIVSDLKRMSRPNNSVLQDDVQIKQVLDSTLSILSNQIHRYCKNIAVDVEEGLPNIIGNLQQLEQVFINLLLNALQALPDRERKVMVRAWYEKDTENVVVSVEDDGVGIPEEHLEKIAQPFFTTKLDKGGTGLGLSICQSILSKHNSHMYINSAPQRGTTVRVNLPIVKGHSGEMP